MIQIMENEIEILAPAGSKESLVAAVSAGADAVYLGGKRFGARVFADNFSEEELLEAIDYVHIHRKKIYLTVNTLIKDAELEELCEYLAPYYCRGLDAVIVQDMGAMELIREVFPDLPVHVSTQATITGALGAEFFKKKGVSRIVPARELSLMEVRKMKQMSGLEIECFVHGALCYCYSGQCLLSSMIGGRSGNRGQCAQPCRLPFSVSDGKRKDILSLKDLCTIDMIPEFIEAGIDSFKIEGRMKQPGYVYTVVSMYRKYADLYRRYGKDGFYISDRDKGILEGSYLRRGYTKGYYHQHNGKDMLALCRPKEDTGALSVPSGKMQEKINGKLIFSEGERVKLYVEMRDMEISCEGAIVQKAQNQPLDAARIEKQMRKTGNTEFVFDSLDIEIKGRGFLPMQALNELRREAVEKLEKEIVLMHRRKLIKGEGRILRGLYKEEYSCQDCDDDPKDLPRLSVLVSNAAQLEAVLGDEHIDTVYVESEIDLCIVRDRKSQRQKVFLAMPYIFREDIVSGWERRYKEQMSVFDGVLVRNWESFQWLKEKGYQKEIRTDYDLYVFNRMSKKSIGNMGISRFFAPVELNYRELKELGITGGGLIVYGNQPVMVTANCIKKNTDRCSKEDGYLYLTDRYQKKFLVKNCCDCCYNVMYNCSPLMLLSQAEEVRNLRPAELRMDMTVETVKEAKRMILLYWECFKENRPVKMPDMDYTKGHFRRGVK
jgi:putative protease